MTAPGVARSELILRGQRSGKSRRAEALAMAWLAQAMAAHGRPDTLLMVDCLTLWLTNALMPATDFAGLSGQGDGRNLKFKRKVPEALDVPAQVAIFLGAIRNTPGPVVPVSNKIGLGVIPLGRAVRAFVDALGRLNQNVAQACERVTLMVAGVPVPIKGSSGKAA